MFEYKITEHMSTAYMNDMGRERWELVAVTSNNFFWKRKELEIININQHFDVDYFDAKR